MSDDDDEEDRSLFWAHKPNRTPAEIEAAEKQIVAQLKDVRYIVREYPVEVVVQKYLKGRKSDDNEVYVPDYQRELIWPEETMTTTLSCAPFGPLSLSRSSLRMRFRWANSIS